MSVVAAVRPDSWNLPLFVHVVGAMILVGGLLACAATLAYARGEERMLRLGYWSLLAIGLPGYVLMRIGGEWLYTKGWDQVDPDPDWIVVGYIVADVGALLLLLGLVVGGVGVYRLRDGKGQTLLRITLVLSVVLIAAAVVAAWAMSGKPG
jgi:hypothetical protein